MILEDVIARIKLVATQTGLDPIASPLLDSSVLIEVILPRVFSYVASNVMKDENQLAALRANHILTFTAGVAPLPESVKEEFIETAYVVDNDQGSYSAASYNKQFMDYAFGNYSICPKFSTQGRTVVFREGGGASGQYNGNVTFNVVTLPVLPTLISGTVNVKDDILEQIISFTAAIITGQKPLAAIGLDYSDLPNL